MLTAEVVRRFVFCDAYGVCGGCTASVISSGIHDAINKCNSKCYSIYCDCTTVHELLFDGTIPSY